MSLFGSRVHVTPNTRVCFMGVKKVSLYDFWGVVYVHKFRRSSTYTYTAILGYLDNTASRPMCEVKQDQNWLVLAWGTSWEVRMLDYFCFFCIYLFCINLFVLFCKAGNHIIEWPSSFMFDLRHIADIVAEAIEERSPLAINKL